MDAVNLVPIEIRETTYRKLEEYAKRAGKTVDQLATELLNLDIKSLEPNKSKRTDA